MTLNGVMAVTLRYFTEFCKSAFQHITAFVRIELIDQKSASITQTKRKDFSVTYFKFIVQVSLYRCSLYAWLPVAMKSVDLWRNLLCFVVCVRCSC